MSQQCRLLARSASNDIAGTWRHFSAPSTSATYSIMIPLHGVISPIHPGGREVPNTQVGKNHPCVSCPLNPPVTLGWHGTQMGSQCPLRRRQFPNENTKTMPASSGSASALPGDVGDDQARICAQFRPRRPPGSPLRLPGKFQGAGGTISARTRGGARTITMVLAL